VWDVYKTAKLTDICGIGGKIAERLRSIGIYSLLSLRDAPIEKLIAEFGTVEGRFLKRVGEGIDTEPLLPYTHDISVKSVGRNYCLPHNEYNKRIIYQNVFELCEEVAIKLRRLHKKAQAVGLHMNGDRSYGATKKVANYMDSGSDIFAICKGFLSLWQPTMVRMISVWSGSLVEASATPQFLFENTTRKDSLQKTIDRLNNRFGSHTIRNGFLLYADKLTTVPNGFGSDRWERKKLTTFE